MQQNCCFGSCCKMDFVHCAFSHVDDEILISNSIKINKIQISLKLKNLKS
jgi:hypothetical protein